MEGPVPFSKLPRCATYHCGQDAQPGEDYCRDCLGKPYSWEELVESYESARTRARMNFGEWMTRMDIPVKLALEVDQVVRRRHW